MSLTTQLHAGELAAWCAARLPGTAATAAEVDAAARARPPVRPAGRVDGRHWAEVGGAFGLRLAALVEPAPPYPALYGLVRAGVVSRAWADAQACLWPTHTGLAAGFPALDLRPTPGGWLALGGPMVADVAPTPAEPVLADLFDRTRRYLAEHAPPGAVGTPAVESALGRVFWLVSAFEDVYRTGQPGPMHELFGRSVPSVETLRTTAPEPVTAELVELARQLHSSGSLAELRRLAGDPPGGRSLGYAGPVFVAHWAEGDLLLDDGQGCALLDVKTVVRTDDVARTARWLWQLLGYAWLDTDDRWRVRTVGLYLARHGVLVRWTVAELAARLLGVAAPGRGAIARARSEFLTLAERVLTTEGARLPVG